MGIPQKSVAIFGIDSFPFQIYPKFDQPITELELDLQLELQHKTLFCGQNYQK